MFFKFCQYVIVIGLSMSENISNQDSVAISIQLTSVVVIKAALLVYFISLCKEMSYHFDYVWMATRVLTVGNNKMTWF